MPPGVLVCGNAVMDLLVRPVEAIRWDATIWVEDIERSIGGNGANTAYALAALETPVRLLSLVGVDEFGSQLIEILSRAGVDTTWTARTQSPTGVTVALVRRDGARAFLHRPGSSAEAFPDPPEFSAEITSGISRFHLANPYALPNMRRHAAETLRRAREAGLATSLDTGWDAKGQWMEVLAPCLPELGVLFVNEEESRMLTGRGAFREAARDLLRAGVETVVVKLGAEGCAVFTRAGDFRSPALPVPVMDSTGAGDCFAGGFLAALQRGASLEKAARLANAAGAASVSALGSVKGLRNFEDARRLLASL
jgi:sugar/nucleoside kinase (ribokinase family)